MSINVDKVYKSALSVLNKEQRGLLTPDQLAKSSSMAQFDIINELQLELNRSLNDRKEYQSNMDAADIANKASQSLESMSTDTELTFADGIATLPTDMYMLLDVSSTDRLNPYDIVDKAKAATFLSSPLMTPSDDFPICFIKSNGLELEMFPKSAALKDSDVTVDYIQKPNSPRWGYFKDVSTGAYIYDPNPYVEDGLVVKNDAFNSFTSNITGGTDNIYIVTASVSGGGGTQQLIVTISGGEATNIQVATPGSGYTVGQTLTVLGSEFSGTGNLVVTIAESNLYSGSTAGSTDFILHPMEESRLIKSIMAYAGISIGNPAITGAAAQMLQSGAVSKQQN